MQILKRNSLWNLDKTHIITSLKKPPTRYQVNASFNFLWTRGWPAGFWGNVYSTEQTWQIHNLPTEFPRALIPFIKLSRSSVWMQICSWYALNVIINGLLYCSLIQKYTSTAMQILTSQIWMHIIVLYWKSCLHESPHGQYIDLHVQVTS